VSRVSFRTSSPRNAATWSRARPGTSCRGVTSVRMRADFGGIVVSRTASFDFASIPPGTARIPQQRRRRPYATQNRRYRGGFVGSWSYRVLGGPAPSILPRAMSIVRLTLLPLGIAAYIGLAILGWGGFTAFFSHPPLIALSILVLTMSG